MMNSSSLLGPYEGKDDLFVENVSRIEEIQ